MKKTRVKLSKIAEKVYLQLKRGKKSEKQIFESFSKKIELVKKDIHFGEPIAKSKFLKKLKLQYNINNLFRVELPNYWRFLYALTHNADEIIVFVLAIVDHKEYNNLFGYKK